MTSEPKPTDKPLTTDQLAVLRQLFMNGPTWDGDIISKQHRNDLYGMRLAHHVGGGFSQLTEAGVTRALELGFGRDKISGKRV